MHNRFSELLATLKGRDRCFLQTHDFPDHDAVASAYGLATLLGFFDIGTSIIYQGAIQRDSLKLLIEELRIPIAPAEEVALTAQDSIVIVDGCKGNRNVTDLIGDEIGVIDHHLVGDPEDVEFIDIRPEYGACSTLIFDYYREAQIEIPGSVATALMIGLLVDTSQLTRGAIEADVDAHANLYRLCDTAFVNALLRNNIQRKDLAFYRRALEKVEIEEGLAFCYFAEGCTQNLLGIIGDFFLALKEVDFVCLAARNGGRINLSLRNENRERSAAAVVRQLIAGIGFGGGHAEMAGGIIDAPEAFDERAVLKRLRTLLSAGRSD